MVFQLFGKTSSLGLDRAMAIQIKSLLQRDHVPRVQVEPSTIPSSGSGVFVAATQARLERGHVACLYPGIYTPPLPSPMIDLSGEGMMEYIYLADRVTPSGIAADQNAYVLNLKDSCGGGYLDGQAVLSSSKDGQRLDENPSACGHLINHNHASRCNVVVLSFRWKDVFRLDDREESSTNLPPVSFYPPPNQLRLDGSPWYFDPKEERIVYFEMNSSNKTLEDVCGAAMVTSKSVKAGEELFLDYGLTKPYPQWAQDWYPEQ